ncbi:MAG: hypothetical protein IAB19_10150 [Proteobacteria bacterium]|uniref:Uncharacterized protein n=1 Tax=Candidatus Avisuccinivibrio stercorigallinarum TaxID=2840704 RepID=A0A9D9DE19_9GAMM|nr:hypothetical protein [Candidatus Avisuccinivibrio stercorigallinarum]
MTEKLQLKDQPDDVEKLGLVHNFSIGHYLDRRSEERLQQLQDNSPLLRQLSSRFALQQNSGTADAKHHSAKKTGTTLKIGNGA